MKIQKGKYYKGTLCNIVVKATTSSYGADTFRGILIEENNNNDFAHLLNKESLGWNPDAFIEYDYKEKNNKQYSKFMLLCAK